MMIKPEEWAHTHATQKNGPNTQEEWAHKKTHTLNVLTQSDNVTKTIILHQTIRIPHQDTEGKLGGTILILISTTHTQPPDFRGNN